MTDMGKNVEIHGTQEVITRLLASGPRRREWLKGILVDLGEHATAQQRVYAPVGETGYILRHIGQSGIKWRPGGAGGGGTYELVSGVRRGTSLHPIYVHQGTANLSDTQLDAATLANTGTQGRIYAKGGMTAGRFQMRSSRNRDRGSKNPLHQPALTFQKRGEPRKFRPWVSGQRPQPFVYFAFASTAVYAEGRVRTAAQLFAP